jgi:S-adenosylmethionine:tRNA ribosyltransferase-isomerase
MKISEFDYVLPPELIAQEPSPERDKSRLMVVHSKLQTWEHRAIFTEIAEILQPGDVLVLNNTKVIPARLAGVRETGGKVELLIVFYQNGRVEALVQTTRRPRIGEVYTFGPYQAKVIQKGQTGWLLDFGSENIDKVMESIGLPPLPPYIKRKGCDRVERASYDKGRYQTVYAKHPGAVAAPTAGLHFTQSLLEKLAQKGVVIAHVTLHVGPGTFFPVRSEEVEKHVMGKEYFAVTPETAQCINCALQEKRRIVTVGTTTCRTLESAWHKGEVRPGEGLSMLFIYPGFEFHVTQALITNFHLPQSTLLLLVSALAGKDLILRVYQDAVQHRYRFYSYGDAMLIL